MSSSSPPNPHNVIAQQIAQPLVLTTEQKLFKEALKTVEERRRKQQDLPKIFDNLNHAQTLEDVKYLVNNERAQNAIWSDPLGKSWLKIFGDYAGYLLNYKVVLDAVVTRGVHVEFAKRYACAELLHRSFCCSTHLGHDQLCHQCKQIMPNLTQTDDHVGLQGHWCCNRISREYGKNSFNILKTLQNICG